MADFVDDVGSITATWTDATGAVWDLTDTDPSVGWFTPPGPAGWGATNYEIVTDPVPRGGEAVRFIRAKPGQIVWPLYVYGDSHMAYVQRMRQIRKAFMSTVHRRVAGTLAVTRPDSTAREIDCFYSSGLEGQAGESWVYSKDAVTLFCPDGYWRDPTPASLLFTYVQGVDFLNPFPRVSASLSLGSTVITNPGDVSAWPTWTITGPMTAVTITNVTTGYEFILSYTLAAGEQIVVTTFQPTVRGPVGQNLTYTLNWPDAYLWSLDPDDNAVIVNVSGGTVGTSVQVDFNARYEGA